MNFAKLDITKRFATASFVLALSVATGALAAPPGSPVGTLTIPSPFGSSPVLAWSWGGSNSGSIGSAGGGAGAGKPVFQELSVSRNSDGQSPLFLDALAKGTHLQSVVLEDGSTNFTLMNVAISSYSTGDSSSKGSGPQTTQIENLTFRFEAVRYTVNGVTTCFNVATNSSCQ